MLEDDIDRFTVVERDGMVVACGAIYAYAEEKIAEIACIVVHPNYRIGGRGDELLAYLEQRCRGEDLDRVFVLTTQTSHWFAERGFAPCKIDDLPAERRPHYNSERRSRILIKNLA